MWSVLQPRLNPDAFAGATQPLIGMPVSKIALRWDGGLSLDLGRMSYIDDVMSWGEALIGIAPDWRIEGNSLLSIHSSLSKDEIGRSVYRVSGLVVERIDFGEETAALHIVLSDGVNIDFVAGSTAGKVVDKKWLIVPPAGGMIYMKGGKVRFDSSHRTASSILGLPPGAYA